MDKDSQRLCLLIATCSALGMLIGATTSQLEMNQCLASDGLAPSCFVANPMLRRIQAMSQGAVIGAGAAIGATWPVWRKG